MEELPMLRPSKAEAAETGAIWKQSHAQSHAEAAAWAAETIGRKLRTPKVHHTRVSLPEWLAKSSKSAQVGKFSRRSEKFDGGRQWKKSQTQMSSRFAPVAPSDGGASTGVPAASEFSGKANNSETPLRPISQELSKRRHMHPRLRWPRLQRPLTEPMSFAGGSTLSSSISEDLGMDMPTTPNAALSSTGIVRSGFDDLDEEEENIDMHGYIREAFDKLEEEAGVVIGYGSVFYTGNEKKLCTPWPPWGAMSSASDDSFSILSTSRGLDQSRVSLSIDDPSIANSSSSSSILPRTRPHQGPISGSTSTLHNAHFQAAELALPGLLQSSTVLGMSRTRAPSSASTRSARAKRPARGLTDVKIDDEKWSLRQAPVSCVMARNARSSRSGNDGQSPDKQPNTFLDFERWGVDDAYISSLLRSSSDAELSRIRRLNLAGNRLTERSIELLTSGGPVLASLKTFNVAGNNLGERGCLEVARFLVITQPKLTELLLSGNLMGDKALEELCTNISYSCQSIKVIGLARNELGFTERAGSALGGLVSSLAELQVLDLHWNEFHGLAATALFHGLYDNAMVLHGKLRRLDISWNRVGKQCVDSRRALASEQASMCTCSTCAGSRRAAKMLASVFQDGQVLFHLDISYNGICAASCNILADGLRKNHTLFGLHLMGNAASVDDMGFMVPATGSSHSGANPDVFETQLTVNRHVRGVPSKIANFGTHSAAHENHHVEASPRETTSWNAIQRNVEKCWICERWFKQDISYTPGFSGPEMSTDEVTSVTAFFSIDGFQKPTHLAKGEEVYNRRIFESRMTVSIKQRLEEKRAEEGQENETTRKTLKELIPRLPNGKVVRFVGSRVLPPSIEPVEVVFQINGNKIVVASDLPVRTLSVPKVITPQTSALPIPVPIRRGSVFATQPSAESWFDGTSSGSLNRENSARTSIVHGAAKEVTSVNVLSVAMTALESFDQGSGCGLCVFEDPAKRGDVSVFPRRAVNEKPTTFVCHWMFETSSFKDFSRDTEEISLQSFDNDWSLSKARQVVKGQAYQEKVITVLRPKYKQIVAAYHQAAFSHFDNSSYGVIMSMSAFREVLAKYDQKTVGAMGKTKSWLCDSKILGTQEVDTSYVVANVYNVGGEDDKPKLKSLPEKGLARFQFFEALLRVICRRFVDTGDKGEPALAVQEFLKVSKFGEDIIELRRSLHECLFTEECCLVCRENMSIVDALYEHYKTHGCYPGRHGRFSYTAWLELMRDANAAQCGVGSSGIGFAFALGKELRVDEAATYRHMEISKTEFLVCIGAVVRLRDDFEIDFFGDMLSDFFTHNLSEAYQNINTTQAGGMFGVAKMLCIVSDPALQQVITLVSRIFLDADEDGNGLLTIREFRRCLNQPKIENELHQAGIEVRDFDVLFKQIDSDDSGEVSLDELCEAFIKMKVAMRGVGRAVTYFRKAFAEKDADGSGTLDLEEFRALLSDNTMMIKLQAFGVSVDDMESIFEDMVADCATNDAGAKKEVTADHMIAALLRIRDPQMSSRRAKTFMRQVFVEADNDHSGALSRDEYKKAFLSERVTRRIKKLGLKVPDWLNMFDALDLDCDGELSRDELLQGASTIWQDELDQKLRNEIQQQARRAVIDTQKSSDENRRGTK